MVVDITIQTEINRKENKLYPFRQRPFHPNLSVRPIASKFYARHDILDTGVLDQIIDIEQAILKHKMVLPKNKYGEPMTGNMEYGWYLKPEAPRSRFHFHYPKTSTWITVIGAVIAMEDQKNPKKPFTGAAFKKKKPMKIDGALACVH